MFRSIVLLSLLVFLVLPSVSWAATPEISGAWGWSWGGSADSRVGRFRLDDGMDLSGVISVPVGYLNWGEFHYSWRSTSMTLSGAGFNQSLTDMGIQNFQLVGLRALQPGKVQPFLLGGIGTTFFSPDASYVDIDGNRYTTDSSWKLSFILGIGAKVWLGEEERFGLRVQLRTMPALYNSSTGIWVGGGGSSVSISGEAIWQWDATVGVSVKLGGQ